MISTIIYEAHKSDKMLERRGGVFSTVITS